MYSLQAYSAIIKPPSLWSTSVLTTFLPPWPLLHLPYTGHRRPAGTLRCTVNVPVEGWAGVPRRHSFAHQEGREGSFDPINAEENRCLTPGHSVRQGICLINCAGAWWGWARTPDGSNAPLMPMAEVSECRGELPGLEALSRGDAQTVGNVYTLPKFGWRRFCLQ